MTSIAIRFNVCSLRCQLFESHHGKAAPNGIGGCVKRTAENIVARGEDIPDYSL